jgi:hypothetical protein
MPERRDDTSRAALAAAAEAGRRLAAGADAGHVAEVVLDRYDRGELPPEESRAIRLHVLRCTPCANLLAARRPALQTDEHVSEVLLLCWLRGAIPAAGADVGLRIAAHVGECERCADHVARLRDALAPARAVAFLHALQALVAARQRESARRGQGFGRHRAGESESVEGVLLDAHRQVTLVGGTPRTVRFRVVEAAIHGDRVHVELAPEPGVDRASVIGGSAEVFVVHEGVRLDLPRVVVEPDGRIVVIGPVAALRDAHGETVRAIPGTAIGLLVTPAAGR